MQFGHTQKQQTYSSKFDKENWMRRIFFALLALIFIAGLATPQSFAQAAPQAAPQGRGQQPAGPPQTMDLATAKKMIAGAEAAAAAMNQHVSICVLDTNGDVVLFERMDTTP